MCIRDRENVRVHKACVAAMPVKDTIKIADDQDFAVSTPRRDLVWMMQTPPGISGVPDPGGIPQAYQGRRKAAYRGNSDHG